MTFGAGLGGFTMGLAQADPIGRYMDLEQQRQAREQARQQQALGLLGAGALYQPGDELRERYQEHGFDFHDLGQISPDFAGLYFPYETPQPPDPTLWGMTQPQLQQVMSQRAAAGLPVETIWKEYAGAFGEGATPLALYADPLMEIQRMREEEQAFRDQEIARMMAGEGFLYRPEDELVDRLLGAGYHLTPLGHLGHEGWYAPTQLPAEPMEPGPYGFTDPRQYQHFLLELLQGAPTPEAAEELMGLLYDPHIEAWGEEAMFPRGFFEHFYPQEPEPQRFGGIAETRTLLGEVLAQARTPEEYQQALDVIHPLYEEEFEGQALPLEFYETVFPFREPEVPVPDPFAAPGPYVTDHPETGQPLFQGPHGNLVDQHGNFVAPMPREFLTPEGVDPGVAPDVPIIPDNLLSDAILLYDPIGRDPEGHDIFHHPDYPQYGQFYVDGRPVPPEYQVTIDEAAEDERGFLGRARDWAAERHRAARYREPAEEEVVFGPEMQADVFMDMVAPEAMRLEEEYGIPAAVVIAQAILETGHGQHLPAGSQNLFGIKGETPEHGSVRTPTLEYVDGQWVETTGDFRRYGHWRESIDDYARFLLENERYAHVLDTDDPYEFAERLQDAGYATDPDYAAKLIQIMDAYNLTDLTIPPPEHIEEPVTEPVTDPVTGQPMMPGRIVPGMAPAGAPAQEAAQTLVTLFGDENIGLNEAIRRLEAADPEMIADIEAEFGVPFDEVLEEVYATHWSIGRETPLETILGYPLPGVATEPPFLEGAAGRALDYLRGIELPAMPEMPPIADYLRPFDPDIVDESPRPLTQLRQWLQRPPEEEGEPPLEPLDVPAVPEIEPGLGTILGHELPTEIGPSTRERARWLEEILEKYRTHDVEGEFEVEFEPVGEAEIEEVPVEDVEEADIEALQQSFLGYELTEDEVVRLLTLLEQGGAYLDRVWDLAMERLGPAGRVDV